MSRYCSQDEQIVMTPIIRGQGHIIITMERLKSKEMEHQNIVHIAGGDHTGIVITQSTTYGSESAPPELFLGLKVMLRSMSNNRKQQENWVLKFWFKEEVPEAERIENAQVFCTELVAFDGFPKDYVDFIKRTLKLMQLKYPSVQKVEVEMKKLEDKKKKRSNQDENYKSDTLRSRRRAEDFRDNKRTEEVRMMQDDIQIHEATISRMKPEDLREMQRIEELRDRERQKVEEMKERQRNEERERQLAEERERDRLWAEDRERERQRAEDRERERQRAEDRERERQRAEERERERQKAEERERQKAEERERERLWAEERERERRKAEEREKERLRAEERERERRRAEELEKERQRAEELERERLWAEERERQRVEERERQRAEERERQRAEEREQERLRAEERERERLRTEERERQRAEELRERQRMEELREIQRAEEFRQMQQAVEVVKAGEYREAYKTDSLKTRKRAEDYRERQQIDDVVEANKTDTMKSKKKTDDSTSLQYPEELKETDTMKARKKARGAAQTSETTKKMAYCELSTFEKEILEVTESVYPNALSFSAIAKSLELPEDDELYQKLVELKSKGYLICLKSGNFMRISAMDPDVKMTRQLPMVPLGKQPTIAIITAHFCEKLAVDTMISEKETFVRFKTEGESQVYTLGVIGAHKVVSTKLPAMGHDRNQMIAAGSVTTRLLGSFSRVEYVFLVGVGGGVAHYTDYTKHVRLGDVVVSTPPDAQRSYIYMYCEPQSSVLDSSDDVGSFEQLSIKTWGPPCMKLQQITLNLWQHGLRKPGDRLWERFLKQGLEQLKYRESSFCRPSSDSDKLYMTLGENLIEVGHPQPAEGSFDPRNPDMPVLHFGAVGSGRVLMPDDTSRLEFSDRHGILAFDTEFDSVVESIFGNRKDNYVFIRGIADYKDGTKKKEWQPYAALAAASVMKAIICHLEPCD